MLIQSLLGSVSSLNKNTAFSFQSITAKYNKFAVILPDTVSIMNGYVSPIDLPLPLVGFEVSYNGDIPFLVNEYSEYPYLNKQLLIEGAVRQNADFSVILHNIITSANPWTVQNIKNQIFVDALEYYVQQGGTFNILTPWGDIKYSVLVGLYGIENEAAQKGISFRLDLKTLIPVYKNETDKLVSKLSNYITGAII